MKFFLDNCLPLRVARALNELVKPEQEVSHLRERFDPAIKDTDWIAALAREGDWVIVSGDTRIPRSPQNREAWRRSGLTAFFFKKGLTHFGLWDQAWRIVRWWPAITEQAALVSPGAGFWVPHKYTGRFEQVKFD